MRRLKHYLYFFFTFISVFLNAQEIHHAISVNLDIAEGKITGNDQIYVPEKLFDESNTISFMLNKNLEISPDGNPGVKINGPRSAGDNVIYSIYTVTAKEGHGGDLKFTVQYSGMINDPIKEGAAEVARGFSETSGIISDKGVYLGGSTHWLPTFESPLFTFNLEVTLQKDWNVVSQGRRTKNEIDDRKRTVRYESPHPDEQAYLIAGPFTEYEQMAGDIAVRAFLRTPDQELANRYIGVTAQYLDMYEKLIGPYPYSKFALVENFWETGFGMPSFTLLGEKVIRLPFILYTSYPHELLHNWWGNSVYVEMESGNWCEGITAYMADHLLKEQQGQGAQYRQTTLQKFTDYVNASNDFPLVEFRSRNNSAEEAIGYGKCLMMNHMLRKEVGDDQFIKAYQHFYDEHKFTIASFDDIRNSFENLTGLDLKPYFEQWTLRKGAPALKLTDVGSKKTGDSYEVHFILEQSQPDEPFVINIPVAVYSENKVKLETIQMDRRTQEYTLPLDEKPVRLEVDPRFDVFRKLDKAEVPPALSQLFGSPDGLIVLPSESPFLEEYRQLATAWQKSQEVQGKTLEIVTDAEIDALPDDKSAWVLGFENKFEGAFKVTDEYATALGKEHIQKIIELTNDGSLVFAVPNKKDITHTQGFIGTTVKEAIPGLARLLPHYGKYSFLGFEGTRPNNVLKGNFPALQSPLHKAIPWEGKTTATHVALNPEKALTD